MRWPTESLRRIRRTRALLDGCEEWTRWFAWHPIIIDEHHVWLQMVERRAVSESWFDHSIVWNYRLIEKAAAPAPSWPRE